MYCVDYNSDEPIMLINKHIGMDDEEGMGIDGSLFQEELLYLDTLGKKRIQVWINSPGGVVLDGYNIFNAILKSKTPVDTYNVGVAASIAGVIFMAGRKRVMSDYAVMMVHPPSGGSDNKQLNALSDSLVKMLTAKSSLNEADVKYLMDRTTWLNSAECFAKGFCTDIEVTSSANKKNMPMSNVKEMLSWANSLIKVSNTHKQNTMSTMTKVTMKLGLNDAATEDNIVSAIKEIEDKAYQSDVAKIKAENELTAAKNAAAAEKAAADKEIADLKATVNKHEGDFKDLKAKYDAMVADKEAAEKAALETKAKNMVEGYAKAGRIKNDATTILKWTNLAVADFEGTEQMIKDIPLNKAANHIENPEANKLNEGELGTTAMALAVKNKLKRQGK